MQQGCMRMSCFLIIDARLRIARKVKDSTVRVPMLYNIVKSFPSPTTYFVSNTLKGGFYLLFDHQ